jgi:hypothetical protein
VQLEASRGIVDTAISVDGRYLCVAYSAGWIELWDMMAGNQALRVAVGLASIGSSLLQSEWCTSLLAGAFDSDKRSRS